MSKALIYNQYISIFDVAQWFELMNKYLKVLDSNLKEEEKN